MKNVTRALLVFSCAAIVLSPSKGWAADPPPAGQAGQPGQTAQDGREHFLRGVEFSRDGDFRAALIEFRRAYELAPNFRVLYNIGQTALELQDYAQSLEAFETYLADGGAEVPAERRVLVEAEVKRLASRVATVTVSVNVPNASISIDDIVVGTSPLAHPLRVGAGRHKFSASTADTLPASRVLDLPGGEATTLNLELIAPSRASEGPAPGPAAEPPPPSRTPLWIGIGLTSALAIGTVVTGIVTQSNKDSFDSEVGRYLPGGNRSAIESARSSLRTSAIVFDVLAIATVVAGGTTLVLGLTGGGSHRSGPAPATARRVSFPSYW